MLLIALKTKRVANLGKVRWFYVL